MKHGTPSQTNRGHPVHTGRYLAVLDAGLVWLSSHFQLSPVWEYRN